MSRVKIVELQKGGIRQREILSNKILFLLEGEISIDLDGKNQRTVIEGEMLFIPLGISLNYLAQDNSKLMFLPILGSLQLCRGESLESLYSKKGELSSNESVDDSFISLVMSDMICQFTSSLSNALEMNVVSEQYFEVKLQELFILLKEGYNKKQLRDFFESTLSPDIVFSEFVKINWLQYNSVYKLSDAMHLSVPHFTKKFKNVFGIAPGRWLMQEKAQWILKDIQEDKKTFQEIASDYGFTAVPNFNRFCRVMFSVTPSELRNKIHVIVK